MTRSQKVLIFYLQFDLSNLLPIKILSGLAEKFDFQSNKPGVNIQ